MASVTNNGFLAAVSRDQALEKTSPTVQKPKKRSKKRRGGSEEPSERAPRSAFDFTQEQQQPDSSSSEFQLPPVADVRATRDLAQIDLATNQRGNSQVAGANTGVSTDHGQFGTMSTAISMPGGSSEQLHSVSASRDRAMANFTVAPGTSVSGGIIAGTPQVIVAGKTDSGVSLGAIVGSNGPTHVTGLTISDVVGPATLASAAVVVGSLSAKGTIVEMNDDNKTVKIESTVKRYLGVILNMSAGFAPYGLAVAARLGASGGRDVKYARWMSYGAAKEAISNNGFFKSTLVAAGVGRTQKAPLMLSSLAGLQSSENHAVLGVGDSLSYKTFGSLVSGMGAAVLGIFAGLGGAVSGEHNITLSRKAETLYELSVSSRVALAGNVSVELPLLVVAYKNWAKGMAVSNVFQFDISKAPALAALYDALEGRLPGQDKAKLTFWKRLPGAQAASLDRDKVQHWLANPGAKLEDFTQVRPIWGVKRLGEEISQLNPSISKGISVTFLTYVLRDKLGRLEIQTTRDVTDTLTVTDKTVAHNKEFKYQSMKSFFTGRSATITASVAPVFIYTRDNLLQGSSLTKKMAWNIQANLKLDRHGKKALKAGQQWLRRSLGESSAITPQDNPGLTGQDGPHGVVFGHQKTLVTADVLGLIGSQAIPDSEPFRDTLAMINTSASFADEQKQKMLNVLAEDFMTSVVGPQVMRQGDQMVGLLQRHTQEGTSAEITYQDEEVSALVNKGNKLTLRRSGSLVDMSTSAIRSTVNDASEIVEGAIRVLERMEASRVTELPEVDRAKLEDDEAKITRVMKQAHDLVNIGGTEQDAAQVARRLPAKERKRLIELQTPPMSRRNSLRERLPRLSPIDSEAQLTPDSSSP